MDTQPDPVAPPAPQAGDAHTSKAATQTQTTKRAYRPIDVPSWGDGFRVTIGWVLFFGFAVLIGALSAVYELVIINVEDRDVRDLEYDYRVTNPSTTYYHQYFINGIDCCNTDPVVFPITDNCSFTSGSSMQLRPPICPPITVFECYSNIDSYCNQTRAVVYASLGLSLSGTYANCTLAGRMRVGSTLITPGHQTKLTVFGADGNPLATYGYNIFNINSPSTQAGIQSFIWGAIGTYGSSDFLMPAAQLTQAVYVDGQQALLAAQSAGSTSSARRIGRWPVAIFDFPGLSHSCPNTGSATQWYMTGSLDNFLVSDFDNSNPASLISTITFFQSILSFAHWKVQLADVGNVAQTSNLSSVNVYQVTGVQFSVGFLGALGACYAWMADATPTALSVTYGPPVYSGPASGLEALQLKGGETSLQVTVRDVSRPEPLALPSYSGMWYVVLSFAMAAAWIIPCGLFILVAIPLIWWNVRSNKGLAPIVYRYLRSYRGW